ncbi:MAG: DUF5058 family protein [Synergistaceae bacterium]|jgi:hypothetical protein|nr:DUF5058 family protein [Synergistaceae bacterium]
MNPEVLQVANAGGLWLISVSIVVVVLLQSVLYTRLSFKVAAKLSYPISKCREAFKVGIVSAVGPSIAIFIVMVGMMSVVGAPITWLRLSIIGAAPTELTAATIGARAAGIEFGSSDYNLYALSVSFWTMAINGTGWLLLTMLFTHKLEDIRLKVGGGDSKWIGVLSIAAALGCFGYLNSNTIVGALRAIQRAAPGASGPIYAVFGGMIGMVVISKVAQKWTWLREYSLGLSMLVGMFAAVVMA